MTARYRVCAVCGKRHGPTYGFKTMLRRLGIMQGDKATIECINKLQRERTRGYRAASTAIKRGDIVSRREDPVHVGQVTNVSVTREGRFATIRWFPQAMLESRVLCDDLQIAEEWK